MEQRIAFCGTKDGVTVAYATLGDGGPPVVYVAGFPAHLEAEWSRPSSRQFLTTLAEGLTLVRYDMRGCGLSDRDVTDVSLEALLRDLDAVVTAAKLEEFALLGLGMLAAPIAIAFAAANPARVTRMVLCSAFVDGSRLGDATRQRTLIDFTEKMGFPVLEYSERTDPEAALDRTGRDVVHLAATPELQASLLRTFFAVDVTSLLPRVTMPVTVLHGRDDRLVPFAEGRTLAARLPNAEFVPIEGNTGSALTEQDRTLPAIRRALAADVQTGPEAAFRIITVLFTDVVQHTQLMQRLGDARGREVLREHERITRETLKGHGGVEVKSMGDGFMASFGSVTRAVECAVALQRAFRAWNDGPAAGQAPLQVRVGLNAGEPIAEDGDLFGSTVILASRIAAEAGAGEILIPEPVRHLLAGKEFAFADHGVFTPKGFDDAVRLYRVRWSD